MSILKRRPRSVDGDLRVLEELKKRGMDLGQPRAVEHFLYFPSGESAHAAAWRLPSQGYSVRVEDRRDFNKWALLANIESDVTAETITSQRSFLTTVAAEHGGEYDGWATPL
jgi:regulator of RNase E activity RraB